MRASPLLTFVEYTLRPRETDELVFCHNDLSPSNIIVDPDTLKINAIIDWEYAGFYYESFESPFYRRNGPSVAIGDEVDDADELASILHGEKIVIEQKFGASSKARA